MSSSWLNLRLESRVMVANCCLDHCVAWRSVECQFSRIHGWWRIDVRAGFDTSWKNKMLGSGDWFRIVERIARMRAFGWSAMASTFQVTRASGG